MTTTANCDETLIRIQSRTNNRWFTARLLRVGDPYGAARRLTWGIESHTSPGELGVEIYDATYADDQRFDLGLGQFVARYYVCSLLSRPPEDGLDLHGGVPGWQLDAAAAELLCLWLENVAVFVPAPPAPGRSARDAQRKLEDVLEGRVRLAPHLEGGSRNSDPR